MQVRSMKISSHAELLTKVLDHFHSREMRDLRYRVFMAANKPLSQWTNDEYLAAEEVANYFAEIGFLMKNGYLEEAAFLDYWGVAVMRSFHACFPMIELRRSADRRADLVNGEPRASRQTRMCTLNGLLAVPFKMPSGNSGGGVESGVKRSNRRAAC
jgi:hypothetical protein